MTDAPTAPVGLYRISTLQRPERDAAAAAAALGGELARAIAGAPGWVGAVCWSNTVEMVRATTSPVGWPPTSRTAAVAAVDGVFDAVDEPNAVVRAVAAALADAISVAARTDATLTPRQLERWHSMATASDGEPTATVWRRHEANVADEGTGDVRYRTAPWPRVRPLTDAVLAGIDGDADLPPLVRGALAYFNVLRIHPFADGNGRVGRCLHGVLAARATALPLPLASTEEIIGRNGSAYDVVMASVGGRSWNPDEDPRRWVQFSLRAQILQFEANLRRTAAASRLWTELGPDVPAAVSPAGRAQLFGAILGRHLRLAPTTDDGCVDPADAAALTAAGWLRETGVGEGARLIATCSAHARRGEYLDIVPEPLAPRHFWRVAAT